MRGLRGTVLPSMVALLACGGTQVAEAQETQNDEIIVTAQKREQNLQDVGLTIATFDAEEIRALGIGSGNEIGDAVAGVHVYNFMGSQPMFVIRGVGVQSFTPNLAPAAATYVDEVYYGSNILTGFSVFDTARVEVLKGPQGTLFGRNTTAGAVSFTTQKPTRAVEGYGELSYGSYGTISGEFATSGPLGERAAFRVSGKVGAQSDGFYTNQWTPSSPALPGNLSTRYFNPKKDIGAWEAYALRGQLLLEPSDSLDLLFNLHTSRKTGDMAPLEELGFPAGCNPDAYDRNVCRGPFGYADLDGDPYKVNTDFVGDNEETLVGGYVRADWDAGAVNVVSISAYDYAKKTHYNDTDGSPDLELNQIRDVDVGQWSQEVRVSADTDGLFWVAGAYVGHERVKQDFCGDVNVALGLTNFFDPAFAGRVASACRLRWWQTTNSAAIYGHTEWKVANAVTLVGGVRYTFEEKKFRSLSEWEYRDGLFPTTTIVNFDANPAEAAVIDDSTEFSNLSGKIGINYAASENLLLYVSYSRGFKSGGYDGEFAFVRSQLLPYDEEILIAYEAGWKATLLDGALRFNGAAYLYDFQNPQLVSQATTSLGVPFNRLVNVEAAELVGADIDVDWRLTENLTARVGLNLTQSEIQDAARPQFNGNELPLTSDTSATFAVRYEWPISDVLRLAMQVDGKYSTPYFLQPDNTRFLEQPERTVFNANATLYAADNWEFSVWGKNLTEEAWYVQSFALFNAFAVTYNEPRTYGATLRYAW